MCITIMERVSSVPCTAKQLNEKRRVQGENGWWQKQRGGSGDVMMVMVVAVQKTTGVGGRKQLIRMDCMRIN